jgi:polyvinyl alcohol dehydrogenase (cytochrome)
MRAGPRRQRDGVCRAAARTHRRCGICEILRGLLYVATGDNYSRPATKTSDAIVALSLADGQIVWSQQATQGDVFNSSCSRVAKCPFKNGPDVDFGSSAMLVHTKSGRDILIAGQKSGVVHAFDPDDKGRILWQTRISRGGANGGVQWGMASDGSNVYAAAAGSARMRGTDNTGGPAPVGNARFDPAQSGAVAALPGAVFSGSMDGHLRALSTADGKLLWDFDTAKSYTTVNGVPANGGSLDGAGPVIAGGMVFVNSGYPRFGGMPGNVLPAFGIP